MEIVKENEGSCFKIVVKFRCPHCQTDKVVKNEKTKNGKQRLRCKSCPKNFIVNYTYNAYQPYIDQQIIVFTEEGLSIRSMARVLHTSVSTLLKRIIDITAHIKQLPISKNKSYEVDEMRTYIGEKSQFRWIVYELEWETKTVALMCGGDKQTLNRVIGSLTLSNARRICTYKQKNYRYLIAKTFVIQLFIVLIILNGIICRYVLT